MVDAYALRGISQYGGAYGSIRLWGSATFILGSFGAGFLLNVLATENLIWLIAGGYALTAAVSFSLAPIATVAPHPAAAMGGRALLRDPVFLAVIVSASLIQASHAMLYGFATIAWEAAGIDSTSIGALAAVAVVAEIAPMRMTPESLRPRSHATNSSGGTMSAICRLARLRHLPSSPR